jgi:hypothetical protein
LLGRGTARGDDPAAAYALAVGALAACRLAAVAFEAVADPLPTPALPDAHVLPDSHPWWPALATAFADGPLRLQHEACARVAAIGATLPPALLATALDAGKRSVSLRGALVPVLGHRGRWLASCNADWSYAAGGDIEDADDPRAWEEGNAAQRTAWLARLRARDPAMARDLLGARLGELPARERFDLLRVLESNASLDDEPLLAPLLKDRSKDVRELAASLLGRMPQSAHAQRLVAWLEPLLVLKRGLLTKSWQIEAPAAADPAWNEAAIDLKRPQHEQLGERAWWLYQLVRQAPLAWWTTHTGMDPAALVAWAAKTDWAQALRDGWLERVGPGDIEWVEALLAADSTRGTVHRASSLLALLPPARREKHWPRSLEKLRKAGLLQDVLASNAPGETLSLELSRALLADLHPLLAGDAIRHDYLLREQAIDLVAVAHPDALRDFDVPPRRPDETPAMAEAVLDLERVASARRTLHRNP